ncbi:cyclin N-terminal domain-containing protein 1 [Anoplolepis gracilipes]|uniref:cyclin N-terminal domain-containing protein 1 n=1 Tax=Anoplolepis gracilipes TaxID=354296 RepID=UPI003BA00D15
MSVDSACLESFVSDWVDHLREIMEQRKQEINNEENLIVPNQTINKNIFKVSNYIAQRMGVSYHVKYMALELFDKFVNKSFWEAYNEQIDKFNKWSENYKEKICSHLALYLTTCFQMANKVNSRSNRFTISQVLELLNILVEDHQYTANDVSTVEVEIFKKVEFRMPFYTPVYCIEILISAINFSKIRYNESEDTIQYDESAFDTSMDLLDLAYLKYERLYETFQSAYYKTTNDQMSEKEKELNLRILKSNTLLLSAAIVLCTRYILDRHLRFTEEITTETIIPVKLAKLVNTTSTCITIMAKILYQIMQYPTLE